MDLIASFRRLFAPTFDAQRMPYRAYLRTPHWRATRAQALRRAGHRCQVCNADGQLDVHHRTYERLGCEDAGDLIVLCRHCHDLFHDNGRLARR